MAASKLRKVGQDFKRAGTPFDRWVQGERSLPRVIDRRYGLLALKGVRYPEKQLPEGCNGSAQRTPLSRWCCSTTHILHSSLYRILLDVGLLAQLIVGRVFQSGLAPRSGTHKCLSHQFLDSGWLASIKVLSVINSPVPSVEKDLANETARPVREDCLCCSRWGSVQTEPAIDRVTIGGEPSK